MAKEKDRGFDAKVFAEMTRRMTVLDASEFEMAESDFLSLIEAVERWREFALALAKEQERGLEFGR